MKTAIEAAALTGPRRKEAELENRRRELELEIRALEAERASAQHAQNLDLDRREREIALREKEVEIERKRLEVEGTRLELIEQRLAVQTRMMEVATTELVPMLYPEASDDARSMLAESLVRPLVSSVNWLQRENAL